MSKKHRDRLTRRSAARLLDEPGEASGRLGMLIAAAQREGSGVEELPGEAAAVAQFRAARGAPLAPSREGTTRMARLKRKLLAAPIATLGIAGVAVASGGVALAASQGAVHVPFTGHDNRSDHAPAAPASTNPGLSRTASAGSTETSSDSASPAASPVGSPSHPVASPSPSLVGLCHAYLAGATHDGKTNPAFTALTNAAGGADNVQTYCVTLLADAQPSHPAHPSHPAKPTQAAIPTIPSHPVKPVHPTQAATPPQSQSKPAHPSHPAKPTQAASPTPPAGTSVD
jgi:hypothetical protein